MASPPPRPIFFYKKNLRFLKEIPELLEIECSACSYIMLDTCRPHFLSCCNYNVCDICKSRSPNVCPRLSCRKNCQYVENNRLLQMINSLRIHCPNKAEGCTWKGQLKDLSAHCERDCQCQVVQCCHDRCQFRRQRRYMKNHEDKECRERPYKCQYCTHSSTFAFVTEVHYEICKQFPIPCVNKCQSDLRIPRCEHNEHLATCPLQPVPCEYSWAGCRHIPSRKDVQAHIQNNLLEHMELVAHAHKSSQEKMRRDFEELKEKYKYRRLEIECKKFEEDYPILNLTEGGISLDKGRKVFFFNERNGCKMAAKFANMVSIHKKLDRRSNSPFCIEVFVYEEGSQKRSPAFNQIKYKIGDRERNASLKNGRSKEKECQRLHCCFDWNGHDEIKIIQLY